MDWLNRGLAAAQQAATEATQHLNLGETAEKARVLAQQAKEQALALAQEASVKAQVRRQPLRRAAGPGAQRARSLRRRCACIQACSTSASSAGRQPPPSLTRFLPPLPPPQEVAKEAISEAEKGLAAVKAAAAQGSDSPRRAGGGGGEDPLVYGITSELQQFVASLTYITFRCDAASVAAPCCVRASQLRCNAALGRRRTLPVTLAALFLLLRAL